MGTQNEKPFPPFGGYAGLKSYAVAEAVYDATVVFFIGFTPGTVG